jgi:hypothetical protein
MKISFRYKNSPKEASPALAYVSPGNAGDEEVFFNNIVDGKSIRQGKIRIKKKNRSEGNGLITLRVSA